MLSDIPLHQHPQSWLKCQQATINLPRISTNNNNNNNLPSVNLLISLMVSNHLKRKHNNRMKVKSMASCLLYLPSLRQLLLRYHPFGGQE